jgi:N-acetylglucosaminyl-diphospho-decaprenol L-rhamnosyltransferase
MPLSAPLPELVRASGLSRLVPNRWQPELGTHWDHSTSRSVQSAVGAVLLVGGDAWKALGGFAEHRFMYAEDHDLFWRARDLGWRARFVANAEFVHLGGGTTRRRWGAPERARRVAEAEASMIREHRSPASAAVTLGLMAAGVGARRVYHRLAGHREAEAELREWYRGYVCGLRTGD